MNNIIDYRLSYMTKVYYVYIIATQNQEKVDFIYIYDIFIIAVWILTSVRFFSSTAFSL